MTAEQTPEVVEGEAVENGAEPSREIIPAAAPPSLAVAPKVTAADLVKRLGMIREAQSQAMVADVDYGVIPGTDKPALLKPGAEKLSVLFELDVQLVNEKTWGPGDHLTVISHGTVFHAPSGARLGYGEGVCTTRERKYAYRRANRKCPECEAEAILKSKFEDSPGFFCWKKRDGCGANFALDDERITGQEEGEIENPDLPDLWNTVVKMAEKRARVDAVLAVTGASALFTQDIEDSSAPDAVVETAPSPSVDGAEGASEGRDSSAATIPDDRARELYKGVGVVGLPFDRFNLILGTVGAEAAKLNRPDSVAKAIRALTPQQADQFERLLQREADRGE